MEWWWSDWWYWAAALAGLWRMFWQLDCHVPYGHCWLQPCTGQGHPLPKPRHSGSDVRSPAVKAGLVEGELLSTSWRITTIGPLISECTRSLHGPEWWPGRSSCATHFYISILSQKWVSLMPRNLITPLNWIHGPSSFEPVNSLPESSQWSCVKQHTIRLHPVWALNIRAFWPNHIPKCTKIIKTTHFQPSVPARGFQRG